jgi:glycosyltransferase involved in cell wall biosynthesis
MKIAFVNFIGTGKFGGGEKWMVSAASQLALKGHDILIIAKADSRFLAYAEKAGIATLGIRNWQKLSGIYLPVIRKALALQKNEVIICNLNTDVRSAGLLAKISGTPVVLARHGILMFNRKKFRYWASSKFILDGIITNSMTIKNTYAGYGWFDDRFVKVIYNGISIPDHTDPFDFESRFPGKKIIYSAGSLSEQKGFTFLIRAAALLKQTRNDLLFAVSGEGRLAEKLKREIAKNGVEDSFIFLGFTADIYPFLKSCDLFVLPSLYEGMPNVVMEAMAMNKPVIATDVNGTRELMIAGKTGLIVPPKNPAALAEAIAAVIDNPQMLSDFGNAGYERVKQNFTMQAMTDRLEEYFDQLLKDKRGISEFHGQ